MLIHRDYRNQIFVTLTHFALRMVSYDDTKTPAFIDNFRLFMFQETMFDQS